MIIRELDDSYFDRIKELYRINRTSRSDIICKRTMRKRYEPMGRNQFI